MTNEFIEKLEIILRDLKRKGIEAHLTFKPEHIEFRADMIGAGGKHYGNYKIVDWAQVEHARFDILEATIAHAIRELLVDGSLVPPPTGSIDPVLCGCGSGPPRYTLPPIQEPETRVQRTGDVPDNPEWAGDREFGELS